MARVPDNPYTTYHIGAHHTPGMICDGVDELGLPAKFRYGKHINAVTVVAGHCALLAVAPSAGVFTFTNDYTGGGDGNALAGPQAVGVYCMAAIPQGYFCWLLVQGYHSTLRGDGAVAAGEQITGKAADGQFDTAATTIPVCGWAIASEASSVFPGYIEIKGT